MCPLFFDVLKNCKPLEQQGPRIPSSIAQDAPGQFTYCGLTRFDIHLINYLSEMNTEPTCTEAASMPRTVLKFHAIEAKLFQLIHIIQVEK